MKNTGINLIPHHGNKWTVWYVPANDAVCLPGNGAIPTCQAASFLIFLISNHGIPSERWAAVILGRLAPTSCGLRLDYAPGMFEDVASQACIMLAISSAQLPAMHTLKPVYY